LFFRPGTLVWPQRQWLQAFFALTWVGAALWFAYFVVPNFVRFVPGLFGLLVVAFSLVWGCFAVYCPKCRLRLLFYAWSNEAVSGWLAWVLTCSKCARCGYDAQVSR